MGKFVSVIVPAFNSALTLPQCLQSLQSQDYPPDQYEIIVADNGSTDDTAAIAEGFQARVLRGVTGNISEVRNTGARAAKGDVLIFIDSDCIAPQDWIRLGVQVLEEKQVAATGCWYTIPDPPTWVQTAWDLQTSSKRSEGPTRWLPSSNFFVRRDAFELIGGFESGLVTGEDSNICDKLAQQDLVTYSLPALAVQHLGESATLAAFFKKEKWRGIGGMQRFIREFPRFSRDKTILFALVMLVATVGLVISLFVAPRYAWYFLVLALAIPATKAIQTVIETRRWSFVLPLVTLYVVYGIARMFPLLNLRLWIKELSK
jgi:glycosyltransferase involved in cell wall biosynthesis